MRAVSWHVQGSLFTGENGRSALLLQNLEPESETSTSLYLRFAFVTLGREEHIFPAFILDDWGKEIRGLKLYEWFAEFGEQFPRAEIFGFERNGVETQCFVRALEFYARLPVYVYADRRAGVETGTLVEAILQPDPLVNTPVQGKRPPGLERPLRSARVSWWQIPPDLQRFDFGLLTPPDPGI